MTSCSPLRRRRPGHALEIFEAEPTCRTALARFEEIGAADEGRAQLYASVCRLAMRAQDWEALGELLGADDFAAVDHRTARMG